MSSSSRRGSGEGGGVDGDVPPPPSSEEPVTPRMANHAATATAEPIRGMENLLDTSSFARRVASGTPNVRDQKILELSEHSGASTPVERNDSTVSFQKCPQEVIGSDIKRNVHVSVEDDESVEVEGDAADKGAIDSASNGGRGESMLEAATNVVTESEAEDVASAPTAAVELGEADRDIKAPSSNDAPSSSTPIRSSHANSDNGSNNKNAFDAFGEYIAFFFNKAEVYEEELELRQSQRDLQLRMDKKRHGSRRSMVPMSPENRGTSSSENSIDIGADDAPDQQNRLEYKSPQHRSSTPKLTDSMEARAAVEAISNFRSLKEVKMQMKKEHSFRKGDSEHDQKKQKVADEKTSHRAGIVDRKTREEWKKQWESFVEEKKKNRFPEIAIQTLALPLSVDEFYQYVLEDDATHSIGKFMRDIGELNVDTTPWQPSDVPTATEPSTRIIHYTHPVNAPMAPPTAKARKEQSLRKFGSVGICMESTTVVEEVPMADCFLVDDRLWIHEADDGKEGCVVAVTFHIRFVKGTMFRRIIENTTRKEYESYWNQFADMIQMLQNPSALEVEELEEVAAELEEATAILEGEGQEVPLRSALSRIRQSSRRLSGVVRLSSGKKIAPPAGAEETPVKFDMRWAATTVLDGLIYIGKRLAESDNGLAIVCGFFVFMLYAMAMKQMMEMSRFLLDLNAQLVQMNDVNKALLAQFGSTAGAQCTG